MWDFVVDKVTVGQVPACVLSFFLSVLFPQLVYFIIIFIFSSFVKRISGQRPETF